MTDELEKQAREQRDREIVREAMADHDKHYWCLVRNLQARKKGVAELAFLLGEGSTVANAIWKKYAAMELPIREEKPDLASFAAQVREQSIAECAAIADHEGSRMHHNYRRGCLAVAFRIRNLLAASGDFPECPSCHNTVTVSWENHEEECAAPPSTSQGQGE